LTAISPQKFNEINYNGLAVITDEKGAFRSMADLTSLALQTKANMLPVMKILVTGSTALATLSLIAKSTEAAMAARNIPVNAHYCKSSEITPFNSGGYALIISTTALKVDAGIPMINGAAFLNGIHYEQIWDTIADILVKADLSSAP
jgi:galactitol-specific phosphotransferase system IIB component